MAHRHSFSAISSTAPSPAAPSFSLAMAGAFFALLSSRAKLGLCFSCVACRAPSMAGAPSPLEFRQARVAPWRPSPRNSLLSLQLATHSSARRLSCSPSPVPCGLAPRPWSCSSYQSSFFFPGTSLSLPCLLSPAR
ncbi:hypothetical protein Zm00014a_002177 [Zea mays]|uniref:Uncharacterized protein n=2 Tax=Zea mays TaxID=4577 RepID=A0A804N3L4_MAIZE|nr:hypothetical protein Zm00014a_002177 [Zea mays]